MNRKGTMLPYLAMWRGHAYLTQAQLADLAGIHVVSIREYEAQHHGASQHSVRALAQALGITPQTLVETLPPTPAEQQLATLEPFLDVIVERVLERLREDRQVVMGTHVPEKAEGE